MKYKVVKTNVGFVVQNTVTMSIVSDVIRTIEEANKIAANLNKK